MPRLLDVADASGVDVALADSVAAPGGLDVLIRNAGISIRRNFIDIDREEFDRVIRVNVHGVFYVSQLAACHILAQEHGGAIPMRRHAGPEELASRYVYLASDEAAYASGAVFTLDGAESVASAAAIL